MEKFSLTLDCFFDEIAYCICIISVYVFKRNTIPNDDYSKDETK